MKYNKISRRFFLEGLGGYTLTLPFLGSLLPYSRAEAQVSMPRRFVALCGENGVVTSNFFPNVSLTPTPADPNVRVTTLTGIPGPVSQVFGSAFDPFRSKMTFVRYLDVLSNEATLPGHDPRSVLTASLISDPNHESIDQVMCRMPPYSSAPVPSLRLCADETGLYYAPGSISFKRTGTSVRSVGTIARPAQAFDSLFPPGDPAEAERRLRQNNNIVDAVFADYSQLKHNRRISSEDKNKVDEHLSFLGDLRTRLQRGTVSCSGALRPQTKYPTVTGKYGQIEAEAIRDFDQFLNDFIDVIAAGIRCGANNVATLMLHRVGDIITYKYLPGANSQGHHGYSHDNSPAGLQGWTNITAYYATKVLRLMQALNVIEADSSTYLDNTIIFYGNTMGPNHKSQEMPVMIAGSGGGMIKNNVFVDYGRRGFDPQSSTTGRHTSPLVGRPYNMLMITFLQAMGLRFADYEYGQQGFGSYAGKAAILHQTFSKRSVLDEIATPALLANVG